MTKIPETVEKWKRVLEEQKQKEQLHVISYPEYERLKISKLDEKRYREEYLGMPVVD